MNNQQLCTLSAILFWILLPSWTWSQQTRKDSLLQKLAAESEDTARVLILNDLFKTCINQNPEEARKFISQADSIADHIQFTRGQGLIKNNMGIFFSSQGEFEKAVEYYKKSIVFRRKTGDSILVGDGINNIGSVYYRQGKYREALSYYDHARLIFEEAGDSTGQGYIGCLNNTGSIYKELGHSRTALDYYLRALNLYRKTGSESKVAMVLLNAGTIYQTQRMFDKALENMLEGEQIYRKLDHKNGIVSAVSYKGEIYEATGKFQEAREAHEEAIRISRETNYKFGLAGALVNAARTDLQLNSGDPLTKLREALRLNEEMDSDLGRVQSLYWMGQYYLGKQNWTEAESHFRKSLALAQDQLALHQMIDNYSGLADAFAGQGRYSEAFEWHKKYAALHDSVFTRETSEAIADIQSRYDDAEQDKTMQKLSIDKAQADLHAAETDLKLARQTRWYYILIGALAIAFLLALLIYSRLRQKSKYTAEIESRNETIEQINSGLERTIEQRTADLLALNRELDTFLYESAHALRRPLARIQGLATLLRSETRPEKNVEYTAHIQRTLDSMDVMLEKLIMVNENNRRTIRNEKTVLRELAGSVFSRFSTSGVEFSMQFPPEFYVMADPYLLQVLLYNLIENGVRFSTIAEHGKPKVSLKAWTHEGKTLLEIADNGIGIPTAEIPHIFGMFYRATEKTTGNGLGLYVVKKVLERMNGQISVVSDPGKGTTVLVELPPIVS